MAEAYAVVQNDDQQWAVTVHGEQIMICARKTDAMRAAKEAARLLRPCPGDEKSPGRAPGTFR
jgi:hypothetical protein